jgi:hypothetical protein
MRVSIEHFPEGEFAVPSAHPADEPDPRPSPEDGLRLVRAFVSIRTQKRRQAVLEYVAEQAMLD